MKKKMSLTKKIMIGLLLGAIFGIILSNIPQGYVKDTIIINGIISVVGGIFINAIKMLVVPLVFVSIVCGASAIGDPKKLGRVGIKTLTFYLVTTGIAITLALIIGKIISPGVGLDLSNVIKKEPTIGAAKSLVEVILDMIPRNPVASLSNGSMLQIIVFALLILSYFLFTGIWLSCLS